MVVTCQICEILGPREAANTIELSANGIGGIHNELVSSGAHPGKYQELAHLTHALPRGENLI